MAELDEAFLRAQMGEHVAKIGIALHDALMEHEFPIAGERVPYEFGTLKATEYVSDPVMDGDDVVVTLGFGTNEDETGINAIVQEFRSDFNHPLGGQAYYLTQTVNEGETSLLERVAAKMKD